MTSIKKGDARYHTFTESSPDSMMIVEESGRFIAMNASARNMLGYSREEIGELDLDVIGARSIRNRLPEFRRIGRIRAEGTLVRKDGNTVATVFNTAAMGDGTFQFVLGQSTDKRSSDETVIEAAPLPFIELDLSSRHTEVKSLNRQARSLCGKAKGADCVGKSLTELLGVAESDVETLVEAARGCWGGVVSRTWIIKAGGRPERYFKTHLTLMGPAEDPANGALLSLCDVTDETFMQKELSAALKEKTLLLKEEQHRIKNNLGLLISMLSLQRGELSDPRCAEQLREAQSRIQTIALMHEQLAASLEVKKNLELSAFVGDLVRTIERTYLSEDAAIRIDTSVEPLVLDAKRAAAIGLIVNELITNALKHAFAGRSSGTVWVNAEKIDGNLRLTVTDDGDGLPSGFDWLKSGGLGFKFIDMLSQQLSATVAVENEHGFKFSLCLKI